MHEARDDLAVESDAALADLLRIANVKSRGLVKSFVNFALLEVSLNLSATQRNLSSDSVNALSDILRETVEDRLVLVDRANRCLNNRSAPRKHNSI